MTLPRPQRMGSLSTEAQGMAVIQLAPFEIDDVTLAVIDRLRDAMPRDAYLLRLLQGGLCNELEELARVGRDHLAADINHQTHHRHDGRKLLSLGPVPASAPASSRLVETLPHDDAASS